MPWGFRPHRHRKTTAALSLWLLGLYVVFLARAPRTPSAEDVAVFESKLKEVRLRCGCPALRRARLEPHRCLAVGRRCPRPRRTHTPPLPLARLSVRALCACCQLRRGGQVAPGLRVALRRWSAWTPTWRRPLRSSPAWTRSCTPSRPGSGAGGNRTAHACWRRSRRWTPHGRGCAAPRCASPCHAARHHAVQASAWRDAALRCAAWHQKGSTPAWRSDLSGVVALAWPWCAAQRSCLELLASEQLVVGAGGCT